MFTIAATITEKTIPSSMRRVARQFQSSRAADRQKFQDVSCQILENHWKRKRNLGSSDIVIPTAPVVRSYYLIHSLCTAGYVYEFIAFGYLTKVQEFIRYMT